MNSLKVNSPTKSPQNEIYTKLLIYLTSKSIIQIDDFVQMNLADRLASFTENLTFSKFSYLDLKVKNIIFDDGFDFIKEKVKPLKPLLYRVGPLMIARIFMIGT